MSPPRNPGAANFNRLMNLGSRLKKTVTNLTLHNLNRKNRLNAYRASSRAYVHAETINSKRAASRQMNRMEARVRQDSATHKRLTDQRNTIRRQIAEILGQANERNQNNTLAGIRRMRGTRLAHAIEKAYLRPGGIYTRKMANRLN